MKMNREKILQKLKEVQHPEISCSLFDLGVLADLGADGNTVRIALAFPMNKVPPLVSETIQKSLQEALSDFDCTTEFIFFDMIEEDKQRFFKLARANWKGAL